MPDDRWLCSLCVHSSAGLGKEATPHCPKEFWAGSWATGFEEYLLKLIDYTTSPEILAKTTAAKQEEQDR